MAGGVQTVAKLYSLGTGGVTLAHLEYLAKNEFFDDAIFHTDSSRPESFGCQIFGHQTFEITQNLDRAPTYALGLISEGQFAEVRRGGADPFLKYHWNYCPELTFLAIGFFTQIIHDLKFFCMMQRFCQKIGCSTAPPLCVGETDPFGERRGQATRASGQDEDGRIG